MQDNNVRVIVPRDVNSPGRGTKSAAVKAAKGKTEVEAEEVR